MTDKSQEPQKSKQQTYEVRVVDLASSREEMAAKYNMPPSKVWDHEDCIVRQCTVDGSRLMAATDPELKTLLLSRVEAFVKQRPTVLSNNFSAAVGIVDVLNSILRKSQYNSRTTGLPLFYPPTYISED